MPTAFTDLHAPDTPLWSFLLVTYSFFASRKDGYLVENQHSEDL